MRPGLLTSLAIAPFPPEADESARGEGEGGEACGEGGSAAPDLPAAGCHTRGKRFARYTEDATEGRHRPSLGENEAAVDVTAAELTEPWLVGLHREGVAHAHEDVLVVQADAGGAGIGGADLCLDGFRELVGEDGGEDGLRVQIVVLPAVL